MNADRVPPGTSNLERRTSNPLRLDDDLSALSAEDLRRVKLYLEDRLCNAVTPLSIRLQMQQPGVMAADVVYQEAVRTVAKVMAVVEELRALSREPRAATGADRGLQKPEERAI